MFRLWRPMFQRRLPMFHRWLKFSVVGTAGLAIQLAALWMCTRLAGISPLLATIIAVEAALLHNFAWHEFWTWRGVSTLSGASHQSGASGRSAAAPRCGTSGRWTRLWRFHAATGSISIVSNVVLTMWFKNSLAIPLLAANVMAVAVTAILNFLIADRWVFRMRPEKRLANQAGLP